MRALLKKFENISYSLQLLALLNMVDGCATFYGLKKGFYLELNPLLNNIYAYNDFAYFGVKVFIPTVVLLFLAYIIELSYAQKLMRKSVRALLYVAIGVYGVLLVYHLVLYGIYFLL